MLASGILSRHNVTVQLLTTVLPVGATVFVAVMGYVQWRGGERRRVQNELARQDLEQTELRRAARGPYDQQRLEALKNLLDKLNALEIQSRWNKGGRDLRAEVPKINTFLIQNGAVLTDEERRLARQFLEGLTWIDHHEADRGRKWQEERERNLAEHGVDIGSYEDSWNQTGPLIGMDEAGQAMQQWSSARMALEARLRDALRGM